MKQKIIQDRTTGLDIILFTGSEIEFKQDDRFQLFWSTACKKLDGQFELKIPKIAFGKNLTGATKKDVKTITGKDGRVLFSLNQRWTIRGSIYEVYVDRYGKQYRRRVTE